MSRPLFRRIRTLLQADAHGLVDSLEERSLILKQYVREAELELARKRARIDCLAEEEKRLGDALDRCAADVEAADADATLAIESGEDDLARFALRRVLERRSEAEQLREQEALRRAEREPLEVRLREQELRFEALRARVRAELSRPAPEDDAAPWESAGSGVADEQVEIELMRRKRAGVAS